MNAPRTVENLTRCYLAAIVVALVAIWFGAGCEQSPPIAYGGEPELVAVAEAETPQLCEAFGLEMTMACNLEWGDESRILAWGSSPQRIAIDVRQANGGASLREHVRHEILHTLWREDRHPAICNGVDVLTVVPSWDVGVL